MPCFVSYTVSKLNGTAGCSFLVFRCDFPVRNSTHRAAPRKAWALTCRAGYQLRPHVGIWKPRSVLNELNSRNNGPKVRLIFGPSASPTHCSSFSPPWTLFTKHILYACLATPAHCVKTQNILHTKSTIQRVPMRHILNETGGLRATEGDISAGLIEGD